jgi:hypothetical protein
MPVQYLEASSDSPSVFGEGDGGDSDSMMSTASSDSMATLNRLHDELERAFGKRRRRAAVPLTKIYYPQAPGGHGQRHAGHQLPQEAFMDFGGDDINLNMGPEPYPYSRYRSAPGTGAVGGGASGGKGAGRWGGFTRYTPRGTYGSSGVYSGLAEARLGAMQGQLMRWAAQREVTRENLSRHGNWLSTFKGELGRASHTHFGGGKENAGMGAGMGMPGGDDYAAGAKGTSSGDKSDGTTKIPLGDGKAIVIRIESLMP